MPVTFVDPRSEPTIPDEPYRAVALPSDTPATIGLLANGFPDSVAFLDHVEIALVAAAPTGTLIRRFAKPNASSPATASLIAEIASSCDALVTAYGH